MLLAALGARHPHDGRLDWLVPSLLLAGEGVFLAALGFARHVWLPVIFALLAAVVMRHADLAYRARSGRGVPDDTFGLGWDGRMLLAGLAAVARLRAVRLRRAGRLALAAGRLGLPGRLAEGRQLRWTCRRRRSAWRR